MTTMDTTMDSALSDIDTFTRQLRSAGGTAFAAGETTWVARTSCALDAMGGFAEYCGALTLSLPTVDAVYGAAQERHDQTVQVALLSAAHNGHPTSCTFPLALWYDHDRLVDAATFARRLEPHAAEWAKPLLGVLYVLLAEQRVPHLRGGLSLAVAGPAPWETDPALASAVIAAALSAIAKSFALNVPPVQMGLWCQQVQNQVLRVPCGPSAAACALYGEAGRLLQLLCQPLEFVGRLPVPDRVALVGIDCGARHPAAAQKFREARTAAFMGRRIIERVLAARGPASDWGGYVARLSVCDYVDTLRDRLPTKLRGRDFLERFGALDDPLTEVAPDAMYKIRSRTEHHIYENARVHQFAERLARAQRTGETGPLLEAGELMFASHWSYGQRCGLGSIETDKLVNCLRRRGPRQGIFGAKVGGTGAGGIVTVLLHDSEAAHQAVREAVAEYAQATGCRTRLLTGAAEGVATCSVQPVA
jgi:galactokinase